MTRKLKTIKNDHADFAGKDIEYILCLATLVAKGVNLPEKPEISDAHNYYNSIGTCEQCLFQRSCLAMIINE